MDEFNFSSITFISFEPPKVCPFCKFVVKEGDIHMQFSDPIPPLTEPTYGCRVSLSTHYPSPCGIITNIAIDE